MKKKSNLDLLNCEKSMNHCQIVQKLYSDDIFK